MTVLPFMEEVKVSPTSDARTPTWIADRRRMALAHVESHGLPTSRNEDWRYTNVAPIVEGNFRAVTSGVAPRHGLTSEAIDPYTFGATDWPLLVFVNGRYDAALSRTSALPAGVRVLDFATALQDAPELLEQYFGRVAAHDSQSHAFTALNTAFAREGAVIHVQQEMEADRPIHLLFITDAAAAGTATYPRILVVAERHSKVAVIESYAGLDEVEYFTSAVTEIVVGDGATVNHLKVQREARTGYHVGTIDATQGRDSHFISFSFATGAALSRTNVYTTLDGEGGGATLNGLYMVDGTQHVDHQTRIEHAKPNCFSREVYKGILDDASHAAFNGKVYVRPIAQKTDGKQENNNLLLSEKAHIDTKPQLEIFADDVRCTHGATVGRMDQTALFYMKSRGISAGLARQLLTYAFAADVLETIEQDPIRIALEDETFRRFTS